MLDEILAAGPVPEHGGLECAGDIELVVAREDDLMDLLFLIALGDEVAAQDFKPALPRPDLFPEIGGAVAALGVDRVAGGAMVALIEGQEVRSRAGQAGDHADLGIADGEMDQGAAGEPEEGLGGLALGPRMAVKAILVYGVANALREVGLQFRGGHRDAVEEEDEVEAVLILLGIVDLTHHPETVGGVAGEDVGIDGQGGLELGHQQGLL